MSLTLTTAPAQEPITLVEAKAHLRQEASDDDTLITSLITAARVHVEEYVGRALITQQWELGLDAFPTDIEMPLPRLQSVESVKYLDADGNLQTLDSAKYRVDIASEPGGITPAYGESWPGTRAVTGAVTVAFTAGYGAAVGVPEPIKSAMKLHIEKHYDGEQRMGNYLDEAILALLASYRIHYL